MGEYYLQGLGLKEKRLRVRWKCKNGDKKWIDHRVVPVFDDSKNLMAIAAIARYIIKEG
jgi:hypothetical protein